MKVIIVGGVAGGASCAARLRRLDEQARDPHGRARALCVLCQLRPALPRRRRDRAGVEPAGRRRAAPSASSSRSTCAPAAKCVAILPAEQDRPAARRGQRRRDHRALRQARARRPARRRSARRCPASTCPASSRCAPCPTRARSASGSRRARPSWPAWTATRASRRCGPRRARWSSAAASSASRWPRTWSTAASRSRWSRWATQILAPLDPRWRASPKATCERHGVTAGAGDGVAGFEPGENGALKVPTKSGAAYPADLVILALGVRPDTALAKAAGAGDRRARRHPRRRRRCAPATRHLRRRRRGRGQGLVTGEWSLVALAGPANRQGRIAADVIAGRDSRFRGTQGTAIIGLFGGAAAWTGASEKTLQRLGDTDYEKIYLYPNSHAGYYPGAKPIAMKVHLPQVRRQAARRAGPGRGRRRQAHQRAGHGDPDGRHGLRPGRGRAVLRAAVRQRQGPGQLRRHGGRRRPARRHAGQPLGRRADERFLLDVREPFELAVEDVPGRREHPAGPVARAAGRIAARPRDPASSAARAAAPTTPRASCCRTASRRARWPAACSHEHMRRRSGATRSTTWPPAPAPPGSPTPASGPPARPGRSRSGSACRP